MRFGFGKYKEKSIGAIVLTEPAYAMWMINQLKADGPLARAQKEVLRLIKIFDSKPFVRECFYCDRKAKRFSLIPPNTSPWYWCDDCDPGSTRYSGTLIVGRSYRDAMGYSKFYLNKSSTKQLILGIAEAKGLPVQVGNRQIAEFFGNRLTNGYLMA